MNKSLSHRQLQPREISKSPSRRAIYLNEEINKKQVNTPFHSPYKNGKPNPNYFNPSFVSNSTYSLSNSKQQSQKTLFLMPMISKRMYYIVRDCGLKTYLVPKQRKSSKKEIENSINKDNQTQDIFTLLKNELGNLHNYRQNFEQKQERFKDLSRRLPQPQMPVYLQKPRKKGISEYKGSEQANTRQLSDYSAVAKEFKELKRQLKRNNVEQENRTMDMIIMQNRQLQRQEQYQQRKQSQLLGNILREQIKTNEIRKEKRWNY